MEFVLVIGDDGKKKAFHVTGPDGAAPLGSSDGQRQPGMGPGVAGLGGNYIPMRQGGRGVGPDMSQQIAYPSAAYAGYLSPHAASPGQALLGMAGGLPPGGNLASSGQGRGGVPQGAAYAPFPPGAVADPTTAAYMGFYAMNPAASGGPYSAGYLSQPMYTRPSRGFFPGGQNWAGARPPPPGTPGFSSGLQVVVHNLPWDCTWQQLKDAFDECGEIERADVVFDSRGRSRGFGIVRFLDRETAEAAVEKMNNSTIGGRVVSVRIDRFA